MSGWLVKHEFRAGFSIHTNPVHTVEQIELACGLREQILAFALEHRHATDAELRAAWKKMQWVGERS